MMTTIATNIDGVALPDQHSINLKWPERYISVITGVKIGLSGFKHLFKNPFTSILKISAGGYLLNRGITGHCELYQKVGKTTEEPVEITMRTSIQVDKPRDEVYEFWRKLDNLPLFMNHLKSVELLDNGRSKWSLKLPVDMADINWEAEIVYDEPGNVIAWQSIPGAIIHNTGKVRFMDTPVPGATLIHVAISYQPPAGLIGAGIAYLVNPIFQKMVIDDIENFKRYMDVSNATDDMVVIEISPLTP